MAAQASGRAQPEAQEGGEELVLGEGRFRLSASLARGLYPHQRDGLQWMWTLHEMKRGGILGDDMGLGKTRQVASFLAGLFQSKLIKRVLIVVPTTLLSQWRVELAAVGLKRRTHEYVAPFSLPPHSLSPLHPSWAPSLSLCPLSHASLSRDLSPPPQP
eukprot:jgi/Mesen1/7486/ME000039S06710